MLSYSSFAARDALKTVLPLIALLLVACGCNKSSTSISGMITIDGKPAPTGSISLLPTGGGATEGSTIENGKYQIADLEAGTYRAVITAFEESQFAENSADLAAAAEAGRPASPPLFRDLAIGAAGNNVEIEIKPGSQVRDFALSSKK